MAQWNLAIPTPTIACGRWCENILRNLPERRRRRHVRLGLDSRILPRESCVDVRSAQFAAVVRGCEREGRLASTRELKAFRRPLVPTRLQVDVATRAHTPEPLNPVRKRVIPVPG